MLGQAGCSHLMPTEKWKCAHKMPKKWQTSCLMQNNNDRDAFTNQQRYEIWLGTFPKYNFNTKDIRSQTRQANKTLQECFHIIITHFQILLLYTHIHTSCPKYTPLRPYSHEILILVRIKIIINSNLAVILVNYEETNLKTLQNTSQKLFTILCVFCISSLKI